MFNVDNQRIGKHLSDLIGRNFKSDRQFCIAYLETRFGRGESDTSEVQNMQNRICQIKKGKKGVQIEDLPAFSELLGVSIEDILSAGTALVPVFDRMSNYSIAFSKDPAEWENYIQRGDRLILNPDEYNKTVIDYALEAGNYDFLKYLMDHEYIWFVGSDKSEYSLGFGAGTSIRRREAGLTDLLNYRMKEQDDLRFKMIALALRENDLGMLERLHARELPLLYNAYPLKRWHLENKELPASPNVDQMIEAIAGSDRNAVHYFFEEFEIEAEKGFKNTYVFPYAGQVLDALIKQNRPVLCKEFLQKAIDHNNKVRRKLQSLVDKSLACCKEISSANPQADYNDSFFKAEVWRGYDFYPDNGFIAFHMPFFAPDYSSFITNVVRATASSKNAEIQALVDKLKATYQFFIKQQKNREV